MSDTSTLIGSHSAYTAPFTTHLSDGAEVFPLVRLPPELRFIVINQYLTKNDTEELRGTCKTLKNDIDGLRYRNMPQLTEFQASSRSLARLTSLGAAPPSLKRVIIDTCFIQPYKGCACGGEDMTAESNLAARRHPAQSRLEDDKSRRICHRFSLRVLQYLKESTIQDLVIRYASPSPTSYCPSTASVLCHLPRVIPARRAIQVLQNWGGDGEVFRITQYPERSDSLSEEINTIGSFIDDRFSKELVCFLCKDMTNRSIGVDRVVIPGTLPRCIEALSKPVVSLKAFIETDGGRILEELR